TRVTLRVTEAVSGQGTENTLQPLAAYLSLDHAAIVTWAVVFIAMVGIIVRRHDALGFVMGAGLCLIVVNPGLVGLRREGLVDNFHMMLSMYIFAASVAGLAIGALLEAVRHRGRHRDLLAATCCIALTGIGVTHAPPLPMGSVFVLPDDM